MCEGDDYLGDNAEEMLQLMPRVNINNPDNNANENLNIEEEFYEELDDAPDRIVA